jgi:DNA excision repair protein ERCC-4
MTDQPDQPNQPDQSIRIVVDTREKCPYVFEHPDIIIVRRALPNGDYSLDGSDFDIVVERKSLDDYVKTITRQRERFRRELTALQDYRAACVVVEGNLADIRPGGYASGAHPNSVWGATVSITVDWGVPIYWCGNRQMARRFCEEWLIRWWARLERENRARPAVGARAL